MLFGLACEGVTDQITIENILCGYFENPNLDSEITQLQPPFDETDQKQKGGGGWTMLLKHYLGTERFRDDVVNNQFVVIQVDTDVSERKGFDVAQVGIDLEPLMPEDLIINVIAKLIVIINSGDMDFYARHSQKIIFAVSVHSLECWLFAHHNNDPQIEYQISGCYDALSTLLPALNKNHRCYDKYSQIFLQRKNIDAVANKDPSFCVFIQALAKIEGHIFSLNDVT